MVDQAATNFPLPPETDIPVLVEHISRRARTLVGPAIVLAEYDVAFLLEGLIPGVTKRLLVDYNGHGGWHPKFSATDSEGRRGHPLVRRWVTYTRQCVLHKHGLGVDPGFRSPPLAGLLGEPLNLLPTSTRTLSRTLPGDPPTNRKVGLRWEKTAHLLVDAVWDGNDPVEALMAAQAAQRGRVAGEAK